MTEQERTLHLGFQKCWKGNKSAAEGLGRTTACLSSSESAVSYRSFHSRQNDEQGSVSGHLCS